MPSGKRVRVFLVETSQDLRFVSSNLFEMEWPRGSGTIAEFPETDDARWFDLETAGRKLVSGQVPILDLLREALT